ncbi:MAG: hypothetical protein IPJ19_09965 [Planctomycetes bacterium]|nr:hypothetical protein [Planctomycetota bacterium]
MGRRTRDLLCRVAASLLLACVLHADVLVMKDGRRIEGTVTAQDAKTVKIHTSYGDFEFPAKDVERVEKGKTRGAEFEERFAAAKTAEEFFELGQWAQEHKLSAEAKKAMKRVLELDPLHAGANGFFGKVLYKGEWMTPEERDKRAAADAESEMLAQGFVRWKDQWVTPEEKAHLARNEVLVEGQWIPFEEAQRKQGLELFGEQWLPRAEALARTDEAAVEAVLKQPLAKVLGDDVLVAGDYPEDELAKIVEGLAKGRAWFDATYKTPAGVELLGGRLAEVYVWNNPELYTGSIAHFAAGTQSIPPGWAEAVQRAFGFVYWDPIPLSSARQWLRSEADIEGHCYHHWGHLLANRLGYDGRLLPPWYEEGLAALMEFRVHGENLVLCKGELVEKPIPGADTGGSRKGRVHETKVAKKKEPPPEFDARTMRSGGWRGALKNGIDAIPAFDELASRQFDELTLPEITASMAIVEWIESHGPGALRAFHDELRKAAPPAPNRVLPNVHLREACYEQAFQAAVKLSWTDADAAWRAWARTR